MIASAGAAAYSVLLLDVLLCYQMIANRRKTRNSHLIDTHIKTSPTVYHSPVHIQHVLLPTTKSTCSFNGRSSYTVYIHVYTCTLYM